MDEKKEFYEGIKAIIILLSIFLALFLFIAIYLHFSEKVPIQFGPPVCGDGLVQRPEQCDGNNFAGKTCLHYGFQAGRLQCTSICSIDTSNCYDISVGKEIIEVHFVPGTHHAPIKNEPYPIDVILKLSPDSFSERVRVLSFKINEVWDPSKVSVEREVDRSREEYHWFSIGHLGGGANEDLTDGNAQLIGLAQLDGNGALIDSRGIIATTLIVTPFSSNFYINSTLEFYLSDGTKIESQVIVSSPPYSPDFANLELFGFHTCFSDSDCNDGSACTVDKCVNNVCRTTNLPDGSSCPDDGLFCNGAERCLSGMCVGIRPCQNDSALCTLTCNEELDVCNYPIHEACISNICSPSDSLADPITGCLAICGNNVHDSGEQCDGIHIVNSCVDFGYKAGELKCFPPESESPCTYDFSKCSLLGSCTDGTQILCPLQSGVCSNCAAPCVGGEWSGCTALTYTQCNPNYEQNERKCADGLDNDCDGFVDNSDPDCLNNIIIVAPSNLEVLLRTNNSAKLRWNDNSDNEYGFKLERKISGGEYQLVKTLGPNTITAIDTDLSANTRYFYRIRAFNQINSDYSNEAETITFINDPCLNGVRDNGEEGVDCGGLCNACSGGPSQPPSQGGGSGGSGGSGLPPLSNTTNMTTCIPNVQCSWSSCFQGKKTQTCVDLNNCVQQTLKTEDCGIEKEIGSQVNQTTTENKQTNLVSWKSILKYGSLILATLIFVTIIILLFVYRKRHEKKREVLEQITLKPIQEGGLR